MHLASEIVTHSHVLEVDCFAFFDQHDAGLKMTISSQTSFVLTIDTLRFARLGSSDPLFQTHISASCFLVALCIASVGFFTWKNGPSFHPVYTASELAGSGSPQEVVLSQDMDGPVYEERRPLTQSVMQRCALVYGALMREQQQAWRMEYLKGVLHCTASHMDIDFYRDAFMNFYRCAEFFATQRVLGLKRLKNETKQIREALTNIGADDDLIEAFNTVYAIRSAQAAHAQNEPKPLTFDDVVKAKTFADLLMAKTYAKDAHAWREARQA
jgi:hypothetical protein